VCSAFPVYDILKEICLAYRLPHIVTYNFKDNNMLGITFIAIGKFIWKMHGLRLVPGNG
jgi:hypothetical protein